MTEFTFIDLFAGIGGTRTAWEQAGGECLFSCEMDGQAQEVYEHNFDSISEPDVRDIDTDDVPDHDVLLACWPCPSFSQMGLKDGLSDDRGRLFYEIVRILKAKQPTAFMLENVDNLRHIDGGRPFKIIRKELRQAGYEIRYKTLNALDFGLPHHRKRLIIMGFRREIEQQLGNFSIPTQTGAVLETEDAQRSALETILEPEDEVDERFTATESARKKRRAELDEPDNQPTPSIWITDRSDNVTIRPYSGALRSKPSWNYLLVNGERLPTNRELLRLQGFHEDFELTRDSITSGQKLVGNSVPVPMINSVATAVSDNL